MWYLRFCYMLEDPNICWLGWHVPCVRRRECERHSLTSGPLFLITVLAEGGQVWGGDQGSLWQAEGGNVGRAWRKLPGWWLWFCGVSQGSGSCGPKGDLRAPGLCQLAAVAHRKGWTDISQDAYTWVLSSGFPLSVAIGWDLPDLDSNALNHYRLRLGLSSQRDQ